MGAATVGLFHQHFTSIFYACRSQKCKKDSQLKQLFVLLGSASVKAARKLIDEVDPVAPEDQRFLKLRMMPPTNSKKTNRIKMTCMDFY